VSSISDIGDQPIEHDPTGVRALLGALPDPGPMPAQLIARIEAALAAEAGGGDHVVTVIPLAEADATRDDGILRGQTRQERRRVVLPWLAAAAVAGIVTVSGTNLLHDRGSSIAAAFQGGSSASSGQSSAAPARAGVMAGSSGADSSGAGAGAGAVTVMRTGASYTTAGLATQAAALTPDPSKTVPPLAAESPAVGGIGTPIGARDCAVKHGVNPGEPLAVDLASVDGMPGMVVVAGQGAGRTAYAFSMACGVLAGPVSIP